jgi:seryl-tRNA synthetase
MSATLHEITTEGLVENGWITDWNAPGVVGYTGQFEDVLSGVNKLIYASETVGRQESLNFPPVIARSVIDTAEYSDSFPHLLARIKTLDESDAPAYLKGIADGTPEDDMLETSDVVVLPATCFGLYPLKAGGSVEGGSTFFVTGSCFRAEASTEIGRFRSFRMHEFVYFGTVEQCTEWRDRRAQVAIDIFAELGMAAESELATDPFFRPLQRVMGPSQIEQQLKLELVIPITEDRKLAIASANLHKDHICDRFEIHGDDGGISSSTCAAFGMERIVLGLIAHHGLEFDGWPPSVLDALQN